MCRTAARRISRWHAGQAPVRRKRRVVRTVFHLITSGAGFEPGLPSSTTTASTPSASGIQSSGGASSTSSPSANDAVSVSGEAPGLGSLSITADETNNALAILATPQQYGTIEQALRKLDAAPLQVLLEAAIAEVTLTSSTQYGVQYFYQPNSANEIVLSDSGSSSIAQSFPGFSDMFANGSNIKVILDGACDRHPYVLRSCRRRRSWCSTTRPPISRSATASIITQQAVATVTTDAPIVNSVEYEDTGVILKPTPRVNRGGMVMLDISQEVSEVASATTSGIGSLTIQERKISSSVAVQDGETIVLGGLISDSRSKTNTGIPYLQDVPVLGNLFRHRRQQEQDRTDGAHHAACGGRHQEGAKVTDELRHRLPAVQAVLEHAK